MIPGPSVCRGFVSFLSLFMGSEVGMTLGTISASCTHHGVTV